MGLIEACISLSYDLLGEREQALWRTLGVFQGDFDLPAAAAVWVGEFESGPDRDGAVKGLVPKILGEDPESAFLWAASVDDPGTRERLVNQTVSQWKQYDPAGARAAIESADLSDEVRQKALERLGDR